MHSTDSPTLDVVGIGNAIVDVIAAVDDAFLDRHGMTKGAMMLVDESRAEALYAAMPAGMISSGGSAGNTIAGVASLGGRTGYVGKVRNDVLGDAFRHDILATGTRYTTPAATSGPATARSLVLVTADAQRTMNTYLGACADLGPADLDFDLIRAAKITYLEGYLYDQPSAQQAFRDAADAAHAAGRQVSLSLSDTFCVDRHRTAFLDLVERHVDVLFANETEIVALFESSDLDAAIARLREIVHVAAITREALGSLIVTVDGVTPIAAAPVARVVDTTGAGDIYAAGFLHGLTSGVPLPECGRLGSAAAAEIISHFGARPQRPLRECITVTA